MRSNLKEYIEASYYHSYAYSYPHKMSYRFLDRERRLKDIWKGESKKNVFLYLHVPFCEMRCGFCNLFTVAKPKPELKKPFVDALFRQIDAVADQLGAFDIANMAFGGGTPTYLSAGELDLIFDRMQTRLGFDAQVVQSAIEVSPQTITPEKIALLKERGIFRMSMGVQSFIEAEVKAMGRPQRLVEVEPVIRQLKEANFPLLNLDLIYGAENQTPASWQYSLDRMLEISPEEVFLYPLYVRPLTGLGLQGKQWDDFRMKLYLQARDFLMANGYEQVSMRQFKKKSVPDLIHPDYHTQENAMIGLGVGARSYTRDLHYSSDYAVGRSGITQIIADYNQRTAEDFTKVNYGIEIDESEQKIRYFIKSFCEGDGLILNRYQQYFGNSVYDDFSLELEEMDELGLLIISEDKICLSLKGRTLEDVIGPWLYSAPIKEAIDKFDLV